MPRAYISLERVSPLKERREVSRGYIEELGDSREHESSLRESIRLCNLPQRSGESRSLESVAHEPRYFFICGRCDMLVGYEDKSCRFCGAEFVPEEAPIEERIDLRLETDGPHGGAKQSFGLRRRTSSGHESARTAGRVDVLGLLRHEHVKLGDEHMAGGTSFAFSNSVRILRRTEHIIAEARDFGVDTEEAKKFLHVAWKACHEGRWNKALQLADRAKEVLAPGIAHMVRGQVHCLREAVIEMKRRGAIVTPLVIEIKSIKKALDDLQMEEAIELTKLLIGEVHDAQMNLLSTVDTRRKPARELLPYCGAGI